MNRSVFIAIAILSGIFSNALISWANSSNTDSFAPTWKLLHTAEKQQFLSGYLYGWRDAAKVIDVAISYVHANPERAVEGLQGIKSLYNLSGLKPTQLVDSIDQFYTDPENQSAPLSAAITAARKAQQ
jgi:hypothetical protein